MLTFISIPLSMARFWKGNYRNRGQGILGINTHNSFLLSIIETDFFQGFSLKF